MNIIELRPKVYVEVVYVAYSATLVKNIDTGAAWLVSNESLKNKGITCKH